MILLIHLKCSIVEMNVKPSQSSLVDMTRQLLAIPTDFSPLINNDDMIMITRISCDKIRHQSQCSHLFSDTKSMEIRCDRFRFEIFNYVLWCVHEQLALVKV